MTQTLNPNDGDNVDDEAVTEAAARSNNVIPPTTHVRNNNHASTTIQPTKSAVQRLLQLPLWPRSSRGPRFQNFTAFLNDWVATLVIGVGVVSYWRGTWTLLDLYTCNQSEEATWGQGDILCGVVPPAVVAGNGTEGGTSTSDNNNYDEWSSTVRITSAWVTYLVGNILFVIGMYLLWTGWWVPRTDVASVVVTKVKALQRTFIVYILGAATVNIWRGIWYLSDHWILPNDPVASWWITVGFGLAGPFLMTAGASLLAPPAIFNMDGPGLYPPPLAVTILSSYYSLRLPASQNPPVDTSALIYTLDALLSFLVLPIFVVWFWRGCWSLLDQYLWGFTTLSPQALYASLGYGTILAIALLFLGSDDIFRYFSCKNVLINQVVCRFRTIILAVGAVSFWRVVWVVWDEFCGGTTYWSAWLSHVGGIAVLVVLGSMSCILAPPATLGVDAVPHEDSADIPLFHNVPVPAEAMFFLGIARQPKLPLVPSYHETGGRKSRSLLERQRPEFSSDLSFLRLSRRTLFETIGGSLTDRNMKKRQESHFYRNR